jgi:quercetin dioxygenase-like cupin family protein
MAATATKTKMYNWNTLPREVVRKGVERVGFRGEQVMMVMNFAEPGLEVRPHSHTFEQIAICVQGRMNYHVGDEVFAMTPGSMLRVPAGVLHYAEVVGDEAVYNLDVFSAIRDDYKHLVTHQSAEFDEPGQAKL